MEPFTHAFTSLALARAGQRQLPRFGTAMLVVSGLALDLDYLSYVGGANAFMRFHRTALGLEIAELNRPPPDSIPVAAIYTCEDGIVAWESCLEQAGDRRENIEVRGTHSTLPSNPLALAVVADLFLVQVERAVTPWRKRAR